jgi:thioredoxin reductase
MDTTVPADVVVIGGGVAGLSAAVFTGRHGLDTLVVDSDESILKRNAHLENFPGFPVGINGRQLLDLLEEQAAKAGCEQVTGTVSNVERTDGGLTVETADEERYRSEYVVAATKNTTDYLTDVDGVDGLYAAGRLAEKPHQAAVCAGHGAEVGVTILEDDDRPFYHDWVAPEGYFTGRGRELPPGCEEIDEDERNEQEEASLAVMQDHFVEQHPDDQETHPSLEE